jgi:hypothetical protein
VCHPPERRPSEWGQLVRQHGCDVIGHRRAQRGQGPPPISAPIALLHLLLHGLHGHRRVKGSEMNWSIREAISRRHWTNAEVQSVIRMYLFVSTYKTLQTYIFQPSSADYWNTKPVCNFISQIFMFLVVILESGVSQKLIKGCCTSCGVIVDFARHLQKYLTENIEISEVQGIFNRFVYFCLKLFVLRPVFTSSCHDHCILNVKAPYYLSQSCTMWF